MTLDIDSLLKLAPFKEPIYRLRCVGGWSMVITWISYPLSDLIKKVEPNGNAKYVAFTTLANNRQMPGLRNPVLEWPYTEGFRMNEAIHPLELLTFGMYGQVLQNQNGAAGTHGAAVEIWIQIFHVDRQDPFRQRSAKDYVEDCGGA